MSLALSTIRQRVAAAILAEMGAAGWAEAAVPYDRWPGEEEGLVLGARSYAVGLSSSMVAEEGQRRSGSVLMMTTVSVRWAQPLAAMDMVGSYDEGLDAEGAIIAAVQTIARSEGLHLKIERADREVGEAGIMTGVISWRAYHQLALDG